MKKVKEIINKLSNKQKIAIISITLLFIIILNIILPTFARFKNRNNMINVTAWDGNVATSYRKGNGSKLNPYVISNGNELAYFSHELENTDYQDKYFELSNDIVINQGNFKTNEDNTLSYVLNNTQYSVDLTTNNYLDTDLNVIGKINILNSIKNFKGNFDGKMHTISGFYLNDNNVKNAALLNNLEGTFENVYIENAYIIGGTTSAILAANTNNAIIKNVMVNGSVIGKTTNIKKNVNVDINNVSYKAGNTINHQTISIIKNYSSYGSTINSTSLTGTLTIKNPNNVTTLVKINDIEINSGDFEIDLSKTLSDNFTISMFADSDSDIEFSFSNLKYNIDYNYSVSSGLVGISNNSQLTNVVNKANVKGYTTSAGLVGVSIGKLNITSSYNKGEITSNNISGGLVGNIENASNTTDIINSYNDASINSLISGGLIGSTMNNASNIIINDSFTNGYTYNQTGYAINEITNSNVSFNNCFYVNGDKQSAVGAVKSGIFTGSISNKELSILDTNSSFKSLLPYQEYISEANLKDSPLNTWVYEENELPILFFDDIVNQIASLHASIYSWNNLSPDPDTIGFNNSVSFSISKTDVGIQSFYLDSNTILSKEFLINIPDNEWKPFDSVQTISDKGKHIIYVKLIDLNNNESYINSDILVIDDIAPTVSVTSDDMSWNNIKSNPSDIILDKNISINVSATDDLSGIKSIEYYKSNKVLTNNELENLTQLDFKVYENSIEINEISSQIIYIKVTDISNNVTIVNTDNLILDGYEITDVYAGSNLGNYDSLDINSNSKISMNISYNNTKQAVNDQTHNLVTNYLLPVGTKITLIDFILNKVYKYEITSDDDIYGYNSSCTTIDCEKKARYSFKYFKEIGSISKDIKYIENNYEADGKIDEDFTITIDYSNATVNKDYLNSKMYLEVLDNEKNIVRPTLYNSIINYNLHSDINDSNLELTTDYNNTNIIQLNSQSQTNILINSKMAYSNSIIDTKYENYKIGLGIKLVDKENKIITKDKMDNIIIRYDGKDFYPESDNTFHINLNNGIKDVSKNIQIITYENDNELKQGEYYFKLFNYISDNGYSYKIINDNNITLNANLTRIKIKYNYQLDVNIDNENRILSKNNNYKIDYQIKQKNTLTNPNIKISLYKKNDINNADNQEYTLINLKDYTNDTLVEYINSIYDIINNPKNYLKGDNTTINDYSLNLNTTNLQSNGYKMVFTLYDDTNIIGSDEVYFIVR